MIYVSVLWFGITVGVIAVVPRKILKDDYEDRPEEDEMMFEIDEDVNDDYDPADEIFLPGIPNSDFTTSEPPSRGGGGGGSGAGGGGSSSARPPSNHPTEAKYKENLPILYLCMGISAGGAILTALLAIVGKFICIYQREKKKKAPPKMNIALNGYADVSNISGSLQPDLFLGEVVHFMRDGSSPQPFRKVERRDYYYG